MSHSSFDREEPELAKRVFIVEKETGGFAEAEKTIVNFATGKGDPIALVLGCVTHWIALAVTFTPSGPALLLADSYNKCLLDAKPPAEIAEKCVQEAFPGFVKKIEAETPRYAQAPKEVLQDLFETGIPEWHNGVLKNAAYWKHRPAPLRRMLYVMEIEAVYEYLGQLEKMLVDKSSL